jgi:hypothetical protein
MADEMATSAIGATIEPPDKKARFVARAMNARATRDGLSASRCRLEG